jgi:hypothetical protein
LFLSACEKASQETVIETKPDTLVQENHSYLKAGIVDTNIICYSFIPPLSVTLRQIGCWEMYGSFSVDIDNDTVNEFIFENGALNDTPYDICCPPPEDTTLVYDCWPSYFPFYDIKTTSKIEILADTNHSISRYLSYIDTLNYADTINTKTNWMHEEVYSLYNQNGPCVRGVCGYWQNITKDMYLGFRIVEDDSFRYGWIKIGKTDIFEIKEIAFEK